MQNTFKEWKMCSILNFLCIVDEILLCRKSMKIATMRMLMILENYGTEFYFCLRQSNFLTRIILKWISLHVEIKQNFIWSNTRKWNEVMYKYKGWVSLSVPLPMILLKWIPFPIRCQQKKNALCCALLLHHNKRWCQ